MESEQQSLSPIKLTRNVYEAMRVNCNIRPQALHEWISQCDDPEAVKAYLMVEWEKGYLGREVMLVLSSEDQKRYYIGWSLFRRRNERERHLPKLVFSVLPDYTNLAPEQQRLAEKAELDAWCELMGIQS